MFPIEKQFKSHRHTGNDSPRINFSDLEGKLPLTDLEYTVGSPVSAPTGGVVIDSEARDAINEIITRLEDLGLIGEN